MRRQVLALLALAAGWMVLVADGGPFPPRCSDFGPREDFEVQYEFQTNCMGEPMGGLLNLRGNNQSLCHWVEDKGEGYSVVDESTFEHIKEQGLHVQRVYILYKSRDKQLAPIGFDFEIKGEPVDTPQNPDMTAPIFVCKDARTHETLAVNKDYLCENKENPSETCELKLSHPPHE